MGTIPPIGTTTTGPSPAGEGPQNIAQQLQSSISNFSTSLKDLTYPKTTDSSTLSIFAGQILNLNSAAQQALGRGG